MKELIVLNAQKRDERGKSAVKRLRNEGNIPGVFYLDGTPATHLMFNLREVENLLAKPPVLFQVKWGEGEDELHECLLREAQRHPVSQAPLHIDLMGVTRGKKIDATVKIILIGSAAGVREGGHLQQTMREVPVRCLPRELPEVIEVNVADMGIGDSVHLSDIEIEGVEWMTASRRTVVSVMAPRVSASSDTEEEEEEESSEEESSEE